MRYLILLRYFGSLFWLTSFVSPVVAQGSAPSRAALVAPATLRWEAQGPALDVTVVNGNAGPKLRIGQLVVPLPLQDVRELRTEALVLHGGGKVGIVRATAQQQSAAVLVVKRPNGALEALWTGMTELSGDRGERHADAIEVSDRDGDGSPDVVVGVYDERTQICGQERTLLSPRAVDPKTLSLKPVLLNRASNRPVQLQLQATAVAPVAETPPRLRSLHAASASSSDGIGQAGAIDDGDLASAWVEGRGLGGRFEFVTMRWAAPGRAIHALAVVPAADAPKPSAPYARPRTLSLLGDHAAHLVATLPEDAKPGQRYWIVPPTPLTWSCLTVSVDDVFAQAIGPKTHAALAEVEAYTDLDFAGGLDTLVGELANDGPEGDDATQLLASARGDVVSPILARWPQLSPLGKRRAMRVLFGERTPDPRAIEVLQRAMRDSDHEVSQRALELARSGIDGGHALLLALAREPTSQGDQAASALAHSADPSALDGLLSVLLERRASERPVLRDALFVAYRSAGPGAAASLQRWLGSDPNQRPPVAARAALALALSSGPESREAAALLLQASQTEAAEFADQWRLVQTAAALKSEPTGDAWLAQLTRAEPWMLRMAALTALHARGSGTALAAARQALSDSYPRVRMAALKVLSSTSPDVELLSRYARDDKWFLVRAAAIDALPNTPAADPVMLSALTDRTPAVRATAVRRLQRAKRVTAWTHIQPLVDNHEEYPEVIAEGIAFAKGLCVSAAAPSLQGVVGRGLQPDAWTPDQELALSALEALSALGGSHAAWARDHAVGPLVPKELHDAAARAAEKPGACRQTPVL
jgi:hypothetical protein